MVALTGVGVYLTVAGPSDEPDRPPTRPSATSTSSAGPASPPPGISGPVADGQFDIYRLLPFSQQEFTTAASVAQRFMAAYGTYRYDEEPAAFMGRLSGLVNDQLRAELERDASAPGLRDERRQQQTVAQGSASLDRLRTIEDNSIIFLVTGRQQVTKGGRSSQDSKQYAVTVARDGGALKVYAFEPADAGQAGDTG
ncbi:hypothetical protein [Actinomadura macrotermitis]|uniref:hypothetical protein n=1 Tax=Actinomadura macrotermitis TaxID=2585200 RepID=UPI001297819F|nr:hypothetical protein [Actinomadura macrotermitis]